MDIEVFQHLFDGIQPFQVTVACRELLKLFFMQQFSQHALLPGAGLASGHRSSMTLSRLNIGLLLCPAVTVEGEMSVRWQFGDVL